MVDQVRVHGQPLSEVGRFVGSLDQVCGIRHLVATEGPERGTRIIRMTSGAGLEVELLPDRALDIAQVTCNGIPVAWRSSAGFTRPDLRELDGQGWLRTFGGGMLATCGLDTFGPPSVSPDGLIYPMHGRAGTISMAITRSAREDGVLVVEATGNQSVLFGENLRLDRRIEIPIGGTVVTIHDRITNDGSQTTGHMLLYHCNIGWPLLAPGAELAIPSTKVTPRDSDALVGMETWADIDHPWQNTPEQLFLHDLRGQEVEVKVFNADLGISLCIRFDGNALPALHQWKYLAEGSYVMGLEPVNVNWTQGRAKADREGITPMLAPGESATYKLAFHLEMTRGTDG